MHTCMYSKWMVKFSLELRFANETLCGLSSLLQMIRTLLLTMNITINQIIYK